MRVIHVSTAPAASTESTSSAVHASQDSPVRLPYMRCETPRIRWTHVTVICGHDHRHSCDNFYSPKRQYKYSIYFDFDFDLDKSTKRYNFADQIRGRKLKLEKLYDYIF